VCVLPDRRRAPRRAAVERQEALLGGALDVDLAERHEAVAELIGMGHRRVAEDDLGRPGYYWLAYEWTNLFFACQICNQKFKANLFPLTDPAARAVSHRDDLSREDPLLVDPEADDPEVHVGFRKEYAYPISDSPKARTTIETVGLNREELAERRRDRIAILEQVRILAELDIPEGEEARGVLEAAVLSSGEYASMTRALLRDTEET